MTPQNEAASARSELTLGFGRHKLTGPKKENALISFAPGNLGHQRESEGGPAGGGGRGTDDDCTLGCGGLYCGMEAACWDGDGGGDDTFCLMSSWTACSVARFWAICSCLAASALACAWRAR